MASEAAWRPDHNERPGGTIHPMLVVSRRPRMKISWILFSASWISFLGCNSSNRGPAETQWDAPTEGTSEPAASSSASSGGPLSSGRELCGPLCDSRPEFAAPASVAKPAPKIELADTVGRRVKLATGHVSVVSILSPFGPPSFEQAASLRSFAAQAPDVAVIIVVAEGDDKSIVSLGLTEMPAHVQLVLDPDRRVAESFGTKRFPETFLVDAGKRIRARYDGAVDLTAPRIAPAIKVMDLGADCPIAIEIASSTNPTIDDPGGDRSCELAYRGLRGRMILVQYSGAQPLTGASAPGRSKEEARSRAADALARIRGGEAFASVASALSDDARAKQTGGDLGRVLSPRDQAPSIPEVVLSRLKAGETSEIEETPLGFAIFQRSADASP